MDKSGGWACHPLQFGFRAVTPRPHQSEPPSLRSAPRLLRAPHHPEGGAEPAALLCLYICVYFRHLLKKSLEIETSRLLCMAETYGIFPGSVVEVMLNESGLCWAQHVEAGGVGGPRSRPSPWAAVILSVVSDRQALRRFS